MSGPGEMLDPAPVAPGAAGLVDMIVDIDPSAALVASADSTVIVTVSQDRLPEVLSRIMELSGARFADLFATQGTLLLVRTVVSLDADALYLILQTEIVGEGLPWLSRMTPAAFVEECELFEQFGLKPPEGHLLNRLAVAPVASAEDLRLDEYSPTRDTHAPFTVGGHAFEFPVGPVRAAGAESLYYGLVTSGEEVVDLFLQTWHKYRGVERRLRGMTPDRATFLIERGEGLSAVSSSVAFVSAAEAAMGLAVSEPVIRARDVLLELERLYNHAQCVAALAQSTGLFVGQAQAEIAIELLLRLNASVAGHRYLFGSVAVASGQPLDYEALRTSLPGACNLLRRVIDDLLDTNSFLDRLEATGIIEEDDCVSLGLVGPIARACGSSIDARVDHPRPGSKTPRLTTLMVDGGDALARLRVRREEIDQSERLINQLTNGELTTAVPRKPRRGWGLGTAESPRGETLAWVELDEDDRIVRARLRTGSVRNWRAFDDAVRSQNVFTDVPIIEASFWLTVAGRVL